MRLGCIGLGVASLLMAGCGGGFGAARDSYRKQGQPITDGFHTSLPQPNTQTVIWGGHPSATGTAISWLQRKGLRIIERSKLQKLFDEQNIVLTHSADDESKVLQIGKLLGAGLVVFIDTPVAGGTQASGSGFVSAYGGSSRMDSATVYSTSIWVRGVEPSTSEVLWNATARYPGASPNLDDTLARLTCYALATAWGLHTPGPGIPEETAGRLSLLFGGADDTPDVCAAPGNAGR